ncbi:HU family DNA-binding protein [Thioalkalivibrio sp. ALE19]|uniref:HU family DNA-binding protein n=1 Tax=Thioalkalivibrio sp. ALE19 TaxID=1266909 RepID=UPI0005B3CCB3|nr:HU family DNA-binding protein [Thioalkalivibrio sp. ALE19]
MDNNTIGKGELVETVADLAGLSKTQAKEVIEATFQKIEDHLRKGDGYKVRIHNFGTFETRHREAREAHNPASGGKVQVPAKNVAAFKPATALKDL